MWLVTRYGFFSVVQKPSDEDLTIRSRTRKDLEELRRRYLPEMGPIRTDEGTDYRYRATAPHAAVAEAVRRSVLDIDYANFKATVGREQGPDRARVYSRVWEDLWLLEDTPAEDAFRRVFGPGHMVLPVIHVSSQNQALRNTEIAREAGAVGVFLINHVISADRLLEIHAAVAERFPDWWLGVNCLGLGPARVFDRLGPGVDGVWVDNAMIDEGQQEQPAANTVQAARAASGWDGLYFGGVAFKYQREVGDVARAARLARRHMDVVTTSGEGTGEAAHLAKIRAMKDALGDFPLAIASGITAENVVRYLPFSDCYLAATGISRDFEELDPPRVRRLVETVRAYDEGRMGEGDPAVSRASIETDDFEEI